MAGRAEGVGVIDHALWYSSRATGLVSLLLPTATMVLGALNVGRFATAGWPRFSVLAVHRNLSLVTVAFLVVHVTTAVVDPYAKIGWGDVLVPFGSVYRPLWLGLGAVAGDLLVALIVTSLLRQRLGVRAWRTVHWASYACWPVAVAHGLGTGGADSHSHWILAFDLFCVVAVTAAVAPTTEQRLLGRAINGRGPGLAEHLAQHGPLPLPTLGDPAFIERVEHSGLRGRGGAGFPAGRKLAAVAAVAAVAAAARASRSRPAIIANGCEGEPVSGKDRTLLYLAPHLVLDGAAVAAEALGADDIVICVHRGEPVATDLRTAISERVGERIAARLVEVPGRYAASEESALVNFLDNGVGRPTTKPPRPFERGLGGRPTMISNVETLAHLALIARYGPSWFRTIGTADSPGSALVTVSGVVGHSQVDEVALGTPLGAIIDRAGGLVGGNNVRLSGHASSYRLYGQIDHEVVGSYGVRCPIVSFGGRAHQPDHSRGRNNCRFLVTQIFVLLRQRPAWPPVLNEHASSGVVELEATQQPARAAGFAGMRGCTCWCTRRGAAG
jgi:DMSO/TMAO reductase YedYZ heme-binding membrane subunit